MRATGHRAPIRILFNRVSRSVSARLNPGASAIAAAQTGGAWCQLRSEPTVRRTGCESGRRTNSRSASGL